MERKSFNPSIFKTVCTTAAIVTMCLCTSAPKKVTHRFFALDTVIDITLYSNARNARIQLDSLEQLVHSLDTLLSISQPKSEIFKINHSSDTMHRIVGAVKQILLSCRREWKLSDSLFDVTVEPLKYLYGLESHQEKHHVPSAGELAEAKTKIGFERIMFLDDSTMILPKGMHIDLGGIAKGYVLEQARGFLLSRGYGSFMINLGGDLIVNGSKPHGKPWLIGIRDPRNEQLLASRLSVTGTAVFTSGDYERYFIENNKRYHHLFNPQTCLPGSHNRSATVVGEDLLVVDAAVKTAFLMPATQALAYLDSRGLRGLIIDSIGTAWASKGLKDILSPDSSLFVQYQ
jgi:FAD:protein FMN transferase